MNIFSIRIMIVLSLGLLFLIGVVILQVYLSKNGKYSGLILPGISFILSLVVVLNLSAVGGMVTAIMIWILANIPTIVLLGIYIAFREKTKKVAQMDKMNVQDL